MSFSRASSIRNDGLEPCHKSPSCPFGGRISKNSLEWFCIDCKLEMDSKIGRMTEERTIEQLRDEVNRGMKKDE